MNESSFIFLFFSARVITNAELNESLWRMSQIMNLACSIHNPDTITP